MHGGWWTPVIFVRHSPLQSCGGSRSPHILAQRSPTAIEDAGTLGYLATHAGFQLAVGCLLKARCARSRGQRLDVAVRLRRAHATPGVLEDDWRDWRASYDIPSGPDEVGGVTYVGTEEAAARVVRLLRADPCRQLPHALAAYSGQYKGFLDIGKKRGVPKSLAIYCGDNQDFGNGPRILVDCSAPGVLQQFKEYVEDKKVRKVFCNYPVSRFLLRKVGIRIRGFAGDIMSMASLHDLSNQGCRLPELCRTILGPAWDKVEPVSLISYQTSGKPGTIPPEGEVREAWLDCRTYAAVVTWKMHGLLGSMLRGTNADGGASTASSLLNFYHRFWMPILEVLCRMQARGVPVDTDLLEMQLQQAEDDVKSERTEFLAWVQQLHEKYYEKKQSGDEAAKEKPSEDEISKTISRFNADSPRQLEHFLFGKDMAEIDGVQILGLGLRRPWSLFSSLGEATILKLCGADSANGQSWSARSKIGQEGCAQLLRIFRIRQIEKTKQTFMKQILRRARNGRVHPRFSLMAATGRITTQEPSLQTVPAREKDRYGMRATIACKPSNSLIVADYEQLELRLLAHLSNDKKLQTAFKQGLDLHSVTAFDMNPRIPRALANTSPEHRVFLKEYGPIVKERWPLERQRAKTINFGILYGMKIASLAEALGESPNIAAEFMDRWYKNYPDVQKWNERIVEKARMRNPPVVSTLRGRLRRLDDLIHGHQTDLAKACRQAMNTTVSGSACDLVCDAMIRIDYNRELRELGCKMILQVHDELMFQCPTAHAQEARQIVKHLMENPFRDGFQMRVPLVADVKVVRNWREAK